MTDFIMTGALAKTAPLLPAAAEARIHGLMPATPQFGWPQIGAAVGVPVWIKHESHRLRGAGVFARPEMRFPAVHRLIATRWPSAVAPGDAAASRGPKNPCPQD